jgi:hypothetical protein
MLLIKDQNGERQINVDTLFREYNIPLPKLRKNRLFNLNDSFKAQDLGQSSVLGKAVFRVPNGVSRSAVFTFTNSEGYECTLRYCSQSPHKKDTGRGVVDVYTPRKVRVDGEGSAFSNLDLAVFMYLHPENKQSPFRKGTYWTWFYDDPESRADEAIKNIDMLKDALNHASHISDKDAVLFAKGMGLVVNGMDVKSIKAQLLTWAAQNPADYNNKRSLNVTFYDGLLKDCIDRGLFRLIQVGGDSYWTWNDSEYKGTRIPVNLEPGSHQDDGLLSFFKTPENMVKYKTVIEKMHSNSINHEFLEEKLKETGGMVPVIEAEISSVNNDQDTVTVPTNFKESEKYLINIHPRGVNPSKTKVKQFLTAIQDGVITEDNIEAEAMNYINLDK